MRSLIIGLVVFLAACNGSTTEVQKVPYTDPQVTAKLDALTQALAAATHIEAQKFASLTIIGTVKGASSDLRMQGEFRTEAIATTSFGPCSSMGVLIGFVNNANQPADALSATGREFMQCTGYQYGVDSMDGTITVAPRIFWDGPNCTGNLYEWEASGAGYSTTTLQGGVVFNSPDGSGVYMVTSGQTAKPVQMQSVWVATTPGCQSDIETQLLYSVVPNAVTVSGIPSAGVGKYQMVAPN